jgi:hypothetical protein
LSATQFAEWINGHVWWVLGIPVSIVLNALARAVAQRIRTFTRIRCDKAEDQGLKELGVPAQERRRLTIARAERDLNLRDPP